MPQLLTDRRCSRCNRTKGEHLFYRNQRWCKACQRRRQRDDCRGRNIKSNFGITEAEYDALIAKGCAICGTTEGRMHLDHCHESGAIREALCSQCNMSLGLMKDDPVRLRAAAAYVEKHG